MILEGLEWLKSLRVPDSRTILLEQALGNGLTPSSTFPIGGVELEQGLGHIDVSLEVLNVVQDVLQNLLLAIKERQGYAQDGGPRQ